MNVTEAVKLAKAYVLEIFGDEQLSDLGLEEVSIDEQTRIWKITVGFARPWDKVGTGFATALGASPRRSYKVVRIDDATQHVISVMNRDSATCQLFSMRILLVLLVVGMTSTDYISKHKRLSSYTVDDYEILKSIISEANDILVTPNTLTEASNLARQIGDPARTKIYELFRALVNFENTRECFVESRSAVARKEFTRLGLTDAALLTVDTDCHILLTADHDLYQTACANGLNAKNFNHLRNL